MYTRDRSVCTVYCEYSCQLMIKSSPLPVHPSSVTDLHHSHQQRHDCALLCGYSRRAAVNASGNIPQSPYSEPADHRATEYYIRTETHSCFSRTAVGIERKCNIRKYYYYVPKSCLCKYDYRNFCSSPFDTLVFAWPGPQ